MNKALSKYGFLSARVFYVFISLVLNSNAFGQGEANNWYFGINAGITFNGSKVSALTNGKLNTLEGCATISDKKGNLLFYTDGMQVWDNTHTVTPNGRNLKGHSSSTQSAIIVPMPGNSTQYYIFTVDYQIGVDGMHYSLFDMSLNSGKGDIVSNKKNIKLVNPTCEKVTAVQHSNGKDYWVITHKFPSDTIYAYLVTAAGLNEPVKSKTGFSIQSTSNSPGYMKVSPDGRKIAYANAYSNTCVIGDFDAKTGKVSNIWSFPGAVDYGIEFSASGKYLYLSQYISHSLFQFDAKAKTRADFLSSKVEVDKRPNGDLGALQIGPDKKIYISRYPSKYLDVIHSPDSAGIACRVQYDYVHLSGGTCYLGLPSFIQSYFKPEFSISADCYGDTAWFNLSEGILVDSVLWTFDDPASKSKNTARGYRVYHLFSDPGPYKVRSIVFKGNLKDTTFFNIKQIISKFTLGKDTFICEKQSIKLGYSIETFNEYEWNDKSTNPTLIAKSPGLYSLKIKDKYGCNKSDTINVSLLELPKVNLGNDTNLCNKSTQILLDAKNQSPNTKYIWGTFYTSQIYTATMPGKYWVQVTNSCGSSSDTILLKLLAKPTITLPEDTILCENQNLILDVTLEESETRYKWLSGETTAVLKVNKPGKYVVTVSNDCGLAKDSINLRYYEIPNLGPDRFFCDFMPLTSRTVKIEKNDTVRWSGGKMDTLEIFANPGKYWVTIIHPCGIASDTVNFKLSVSPKVNLGKDTSLCGNFQLLLDAQNPGMIYNWQPTGEKTQTILARQQIIYSVKVTNIDGCETEDQLSINGNCISNFWFPNSFSPNSDKINETFKPTLINFEDFEMRIYNRWSELLFETDSIEKGWDGTYQGNICQEGVYFFISHFRTTENNKKQLVKGTLTLIK